MKKPTLAELLGKREEGNRMLEEGAITSTTSTPFFDQVMAHTQGNESFEALVANVTGPVDPAALPKFPTPKCLTAEQASGMAGFGQREREHLATCPWCKNMMSVGQPSVQEFDEILRRVKKETERSHQHEAAAF